jgi:hypothetical protein
VHNEPHCSARRISEGNVQGEITVRYGAWAAFIRFIIEQLDSHWGRRQGLFQAELELRASGNLAPRDYQRLKIIFGWFDANLDKPARLSLSPRPNAKAQGICWFRSTANARISKMRELQRLLESYGLAVETIRTRPPGYILYEDELQVAAYPFSDTPT